MFEENPDKIDWCSLSGNPAAIQLLEKNPDRIFWYYLSSNPLAIDLIEEMLKTKPDKIDWFNFCSGNKDYNYYNYYLEYIKPNNNEYILK
jgi:hypothetical protein